LCFSRLIFFIIMIFWNYFLVVTTDPGRVSPNWIPPKSASFEVKKSTHTPRFCKTCSNYKPPRAHHCRSCNRCVLRMDHHCPWIDNCVGHHNYAHFIRFLLYVDMGTFYIFVLLCLRVYRLADDARNFRSNAEPSTPELVFVVVNFCLDVPVMFSVGFLTSFHTYTMFSNTTTIETWEKDKVATMVQRGKIASVKFPYDLGCLSNYKIVLGPNVLLWLWPQPARGDGLSFPMAKDQGRTHVVYTHDAHGNVNSNGSEEDIVPLETVRVVSGSSMSTNLDEL